MSSSGQDELFEREVRDALLRRAPAAAPSRLRARVSRVPVAGATAGHAGNGRRGGWFAWGRLVSAGLLVGVALVATGLLLAGRSKPPATGQPSAPAVASGVASTALTSPPSTVTSPVPSATAAASPTKSASPALAALTVPARLRTTVPLPHGMTLSAPWDLRASSTWVVAALNSGATDSAALYAIRIADGLTRRLAATSPTVFAVDGNTAAWASMDCASSNATPGGLTACSSWQIHWANLTDGSSKVVARGTGPDLVSPAWSGPGSVPLVPALALSNGQLAYTHGSLADGVTLTAVNLWHTGAQPLEIRLGGMAEGLIWIGSDLAWIEDGGLSRPDWSAPFAAYATSSLKVLEAGSDTPRSIAGDYPYWLASDGSRLGWESNSGIQVASAPDWTPDTLTSVSDGTGLSGYSLSMSNGWTGWWQDTPDTTAMAVVGPGGSAAEVVSNGEIVGGGWLIGGPKNELGNATALWVVPLASLR